MSALSQPPGTAGSTDVTDVTDVSSAQLCSAQLSSGKLSSALLSSPGSQGAQPSCGAHSPAFGTLQMPVPSLLWDQLGVGA